MPAYAIEPLVTATAINTGGREGHSETTDHSVSADLSVRNGDRRTSSVHEGGGFGIVVKMQIKMPHLLPPVRRRWV
jgi:hypothetical protein